MTNPLIADLETIADNVERFGGWHVATTYLRAAADQIERMEEALKAIRLRMHFIGWPNEPMWIPHHTLSPMPDWRKQIQIVELALRPSVPHPGPGIRMPSIIDTVWGSA